MAEPADQRTITIEILTAILPAIIAHGAELSMLQTEAAIEWAKENIYIPTGVRGNRGDSDKGENWVESMLRGPPERMQDTLRMTPRQFKLLLRWLEEEAGFKCGYVSARVKLAIFLYIVAQNAPWRTIRNHFGVALRTVMKAFYEVLDAITKHLYQAVVRLPPDDEVPNGIQGNPERMPFFEGCRGVVDGSHIPLVPLGEDPEPWRNRKGFISQNIVATCDFQSNFTYLRAGYEGSLSDSTVFEWATEADLQVPGTDTYLVADAGYNDASIHQGRLLTPYLNVRYDLKEWERETQQPQTKEELFNLRHASLRNAVERTFGVWKGRFHILRSPRRLPIRAQRQLIYALAALHNFLNLSGSNPDSEYNRLEARGLLPVEEDVDKLHPPRERGDDATDLRRRDEIAEKMWHSYLKNQAMDLSDTTKR
jgi:DDE superfamily endonuclease